MLPAGWPVIIHIALPVVTTISTGTNESYAAVISKQKYMLVNSQQFQLKFDFRNYLPARYADYNR